MAEQRPAAKSRRPLRALRQAEIQTYAQQGVVHLAGVFDAGWIDHLRAAVEQALAQPGPLAEDYAATGSTGRFFGDLDLNQRLPAFREFVLESPAAEIAGTLMGSVKVNFFYDQLFVKEPGTVARTPWHQDQPYWAVSGRQVCSMWLPLDSISRESALAYVKGSHAWDAHNPHHFIDDTPYQDTGLPELPDIDAHPEQFEFLGWDVEPGDCLVFQAMMVHGSAGNASLTRRRRALSTRWTGDDARFVRRQGEVAIPTSDPGLADGAVMDCDLLPVVWRMAPGTGRSQ